MATTTLNKEAKALLDAIRQVESGVDVVPPGWLSMNQLKSELHLGKSTVQQKLASVPHEVKKFKIRHQTGAISRVPHYRLKA